MLYDALPLLRQILPTSSMTLQTEVLGLMRHPHSPLNHPLTVRLSGTITPRTPIERRPEGAREDIAKTQLLASGAQALKVEQEMPWEFRPGVQ